MDLFFRVSLVLLMLFSAFVIINVDRWNEENCSNFGKAVELSSFWDTNTKACYVRLKNGSIVPRHKYVGENNGN